MSHDESTMFSTKSLRFSTDVHGRLYAALAADEQRRVVQLSFTGCVNFSDMSDIDVGWCWYLAREMDETAWKWLEWGMGELEACWKKSRLGRHEQRGFDFRHPCVWMAKNKNFEAFTKIISQTLWNFSLKMLKRHDFIPGVWTWHFFWSGSSQHLLIFPNPGDFGEVQTFCSGWIFLSSKRLGRNETYHVNCQIHSKRFMFSIHLFVKVYSSYTFFDIVIDMQKKTQGDTQLDLLLQHLPPQLQVLRSSTARSWGEMPEPWRGRLMSIQRVTSFI